MPPGKTSSPQRPARSPGSGRVWWCATGALVPSVTVHAGAGAPRGAAQTPRGPEPSVPEKDPLPSCLCDRRPDARARAGPSAVSLGFGCGARRCLGSFSRMVGAGVAMGEPLVGHQQAVLGFPSREGVLGPLSGPESTTPGVPSALPPRGQPHVVTPCGSRCQEHRPP